MWIDSFLQFRDDRLWKVYIFENEDSLQSFYDALTRRTLEQQTWFEQKVQNGMILLWTVY